MRRRQAGDRATGMVRLIDRCAEKYVECVANDLGDSTVVGEHDVSHADEGVAPKHDRLDRFRQCAFAAQIEGVGAAGQAFGGFCSGKSDGGAAFLALGCRSRAVGGLSIKSRPCTACGPSAGRGNRLFCLEI